MVNRLLRQPQRSKVFEWRGPTYTPVTYEFLALWFFPFPKKSGKVHEK